jgi:sulfopyruvate decarboxylase TPP-binding subunit
MMNAATPSWEDDIFDAFKSAGVSQVPYVPDAGHAHLIRRVHADPAMTPLVLTTEEEGVASCCGAWLGGKKIGVVDAVKRCW